MQMKASLRPDLRQVGLPLFALLKDISQPIVVAVHSNALSRVVTQPVLYFELKKRGTMMLPPWPILASQQPLNAAFYISSLTLNPPLFSVYSLNLPPPLLLL